MTDRKTTEAERILLRLREQVAQATEQAYRELEALGYRATDKRRVSDRQ